MIEALINLLSQGEKDPGEWIQVVVFLVLMVFWIVGGLLKASKQKKYFNSEDQEDVDEDYFDMFDEDDDFEQTQPETKPDSYEKFKKQKPQTQDDILKEYYKSRAPQSPAELESKLDTKIYEPSTGYSMVSPQYQVDLSKDKDSLVETTTLKTEKAKRVNRKARKLEQYVKSTRKTKKAPQTTKKEEQTVPMKRFSQYDELKRAVIYSEVLGKPKSLKDELY